MNIFDLFLYFILCSVLGYILENIYYFFIAQIRNTKTTHLTYGYIPYSPPYGIGAILGLGVSTIQIPPIVLIFVLILGFGFIEFFSSYTAELVFKTKVWDYNGRPLNINGRTTLPHMVIFGILGSLYIFLFQNSLLSFIQNVPDKIVYIFPFFVLSILVLDSYITRKSPLRKI
jgi:uncharacterized membrane protein